jgi:hypothetical protein
MLSLHEKTSLNNEGEAPSTSFAQSMRGLLNSHQPQQQRPTNIANIIIRRTKWAN